MSANGLEAPVEEKRGNELIEQEELVHVRARRGVRDIDKHCGVYGWLRRRLTGCQHDAKKMPHGSEQLGEGDEDRSVRVQWFGGCGLSRVGNPRRDGNRLSSGKSLLDRVQKREELKGNGVILVGGEVS